jgi:hypothetical protein
VAFVLHQFPIGYMPVAASRASRQLSQTEEEQAVGLRFPPQDHPQARLVEDTDALQRVRSGEAYESARRERAERSEVQEIPEELTARHDPLGELSELEWERAYVLRTGGEGERSEYAWPPAQECPEGGVEAGEAVVLEPDVVVDCLGSGEERVVFAAKTPFAQRSLPPEYRERGYRRFRVMRPLPVWQAVSAPWFGQPGGGVRYRTTYPLADLVALGHLVELTKDREAAEAATLRLTRDDVRPAGAGSTREAAQ